MLKARKFGGSWSIALVGWLASALPGTATLADYSISNNLAQPTAGTESAAGDTYLTSSFGGGSAGGTLSSVTLLISSGSVGSSAEVDIYSDDTLSPNSMLQKLSSSGSLSSSLGSVTFTSSGLSISANTTYWVVLKALAGQVNWAYSASSSGTGTGFQHTFGESDDAGSTWFTYDSYPTKMDVSLVSPLSVPEPHSILLLASGAALAGLAYRNTSRRKVAA